VFGVAGALGWAAGARALPWALAPLLPALLAATLALAWHKAGRAILPARQLGHALLYALVRMPGYLRLPPPRRAPPIRPGRDEPGPG
jgi:hypothetical protein